MCVHTQQKRIISHYASCFLDGLKTSMVKSHETNAFFMSTLCAFCCIYLFEQGQQKHIHTCNNANLLLCDITTNVWVKCAHPAQRSPKVDRIFLDNFFIHVVK